MNAVQESAESGQPKKGRTVRRVLTAIGIVLCVILIPLVTLNLILIIKGYANKDEVPSVFSVSPVYVLTDSMEPAINGGDLIFIKKVAPSKIAVDDVIAFFDPDVDAGEIIVHRVKAIHTDEEGNLTFRTKGDANNVYDTFVVSAENLVGRYSFRMRGMGKVAMFMQSKYGLTLCIVLPVILIVGVEVIRRLARSDKKQQNQTDEKSE